MDTRFGLVLFILLYFSTVRSHDWCDDLKEDEKSSCETEGRVLSHMENHKETLSKQLQDLVVGAFAVPTLDAGGLCGQQTRLAHEAAKRFDIWALKMFESSSKLPSGMFKGNVNDMGDFDQCLSVQHEDVVGKYCLVLLNVQLVNETSKHLKQLFEYNTFGIVDYSEPPEHTQFFTSIKSAICVPASCSIQQIEGGVSKSLAKISLIPELSLQVKVDPHFCHINEEVHFDFITLAVLILFVTILGLIVASTNMDHSDKPQSKIRQIVMAFSLRRTWKQLIDVETQSGDLINLHCSRFLSALALLICHKSLIISFDPVTNKSLLNEQWNKAYTIPARKATLYTDSFICFSGIVCSYSLIPELDRKNGRVDILSKYKSRILRIYPSFMVIILFCTYVLPMLGSGPLWYYFISSYADVCKKSIWKNFLFIHNFSGFNDMCLPFTHQLAMDMQFYFISPFLIFILWKWPRLGTITLLSIAGYSTWLRYITTKTHHLSDIFYNGITPRKIVDTLNLSYYMPTHRISSYMFGLLLGYVLRRYPKGLTLSKTQEFILKRVILIVLPTLCLDTFYSACYHDFEYDVTIMAIYSALSPVLWCIFIFIGLLVHHPEDTYGYFGKFARWKGFVIFSRISYAYYLTQIPIIMYNIGSKREAGSATASDVYNIPEHATVIAASVMLTLFIDLPFQEVKRVLSK